MCFLGFFTFLVALAHGVPCRKLSLLSKGQLISKCFFGAFTFFQKTNAPYCMETFMAIRVVEFSNGGYKIRNVFV